MWTRSIARLCIVGTIALTVAACSSSKSDKPLMHYATDVTCPAATEISRIVGDTLKPADPLPDHDGFTICDYDAGLDKGSVRIEFETLEDREDFRELYNDTKSGMDNYEDAKLRKLDDIGDDAFLFTHGGNFPIVELEVRFGDALVWVDVTFLGATEEKARELMRLAARLLMVGA